jgi:hypothetical protein
VKVRTAKGAVLDMGRLMAQNEHAIALGNASMNARGDIIGPGGEIVKRREQVAQDYYAANPKAVKTVALRNIQADVFVSPAEAMAALEPAKTAETKEPTAVDPTTQRKRKIVDRDN